MSDPSLSPDQTLHAYNPEAIHERTLAFKAPGLHRDSRRRECRKQELRADVRHRARARLA